MNRATNGMFMLGSPSRPFRTRMKHGPAASSRMPLRPARRPEAFAIMDEYRVRLPVFDGPLDLLLYLVKKNEVDVCDIPVAVIADQFRAYLSMLRTIDVELAGEFVVMA